MVSLKYSQYQDNGPTDQSLISSKSFISLQNYVQAKVYALRYSSFTSGHMYKLSLLLSLFETLSLSLIKLCPKKVCFITQKDTWGYKLVPFQPQISFKLKN